MKICTDRLHVAMARKDINFKQLAQSANVSRATLSYINNGKKCSPQTVGRLASALQCEVEYLLEQTA